MSQSDWENSSADWVTCLLTQKPLGVDCGVKPHDTPNKHLWYLLHFSLSAQGIVNFFIYGFMSENFLMWINKAGELLQIPWCQRLGTAEQDKPSSKSDITKSDPTQSNRNVNIAKSPSTRAALKMDERKNRPKDEEDDDDS